jgi:hypothetical protein
MTALVAAYEEMGYAREAAVQAAARQLARQAKRAVPAPAPRPWAPEYRWASGALCLNLGLALFAAQSAALVAHGGVALAMLGAGQALAGMALGRALRGKALARGLLLHHGGYFGAVAGGGLLAATLSPMAGVDLAAGLALVLGALGLGSLAARVAATRARS